MSLAAAAQPIVASDRTPSRYELRIDSLRQIFDDPALVVTSNSIITRDRTFPIVDDVVILLPSSQISDRLAQRVAGASDSELTRPHGYELDRDVQYSFGAEWTRFPEILPEHEREFAQYFDLAADLPLRDWRIIDLGCGIGRWSFFLSSRCREVLLVDFSEAIFVAKKNLAGVENALFFMGDIMNLPFKSDCAECAVCLGVLHHLPMDPLKAVRAISRISGNLLVYLYYALDNRPIWYRALWRLSDLVRTATSAVKSPLMREALCWILTLLFYMPFVLIGKLLAPLGLARNIPNFEAHKNDSLRRIRQDCYDRFFTSIESRVSAKEIRTLGDTFSSILISPNPPYWHFLCSRGE